MLLKLNSTDEVAKLIRCLKILPGKVGLRRDIATNLNSFFKRNVCIKGTNVKGAHKHISWAEVSDNLGKRKRIFYTETATMLQHRLKH